MQVLFAETGSSEPFRELYEQYIPDLVGRAISSSNGVPIKCIFHPDVHPSAFVNPVNGVYGCSVCELSMSVRRFLIEGIGLSRVDADAVLSMYQADEIKFPKKDDFYGGIYAAPSIKMTDFAINAQRNLSPEIPLVREYIEQKGIRFETLEAFNCGYIPESPIQRECLVIPYYAYNTNKVVALRGRNIHGRKGGAPGSRYVPLICPGVQHETAIVVEGESDAMIAWQAINDEGLPISVYGVPGALFKREWTREFQGAQRVLIVPQADEPSYRKFMGPAKEALGDRAREVELPWGRGEIGKDVADWLRIHSPKEFVALLPMFASNRRIMSTDEMIAEGEKDVPWLVTNMISRGDKVIISAPQKSMKTWLVLFMIASLAKGTPILEAAEWQVDEPRKIMFVEEEGTSNALGKRISRIMKTGEIPPDQIRWLHKHTVRLDNPLGLKYLMENIEREMPDLLILDPMQRLHGQDEDSSTEMAIVWDAIHGLTVKYPFLAVVVVHHFRKGGESAMGWESMRGSSRTAGEADVGIFVRKEPRVNENNLTVLRMRVEGRDLPPLLRDENGNDELEVLVDTTAWTARVKSFGVSVNSLRRDGNLEQNILELLPMTSQEIIERTGLSASAVSNMMTRYEKEGKVRREKVLGRGKKNLWFATGVGDA